MKNKIFLYSLTSLAVTASALAQANQDAYVPALEGGVTASVGTFYVTPTSNFQEFASTSNENFTNIENVNPGYEFGIDASLGYIFEKTANGVELFFRNISTSDTGSAEGLIDETPFVANGDLGYELDSFDLMFTQFVDLGQVMQVRFMGGLAYLDLNSNETATGTSAVGDLASNQAESDSALFQAQSKFRGWGPRVSIDTRYGFEDSVEGLGIVGGGSMAYFQGDMDTNVTYPDQLRTNKQEYLENNPGNHAVLNFRANLGLDYVFFFDNDEKSTMGLELGYLVDYYNDGAASPAPIDTDVPFNGTFQTTSVSFAGPYLNLKGAF